MRSRRLVVWPALLVAAAGVWLFVSPWAMQAVTPTPPAATNAWIVGALLAVVALLSLRDGRLEWLAVGAAAWLFVAPWVLPYATRFMAWNAWAVGAAAFVLALLGAGAGHRAERIRTG